MYSNLRVRKFSLRDTIFLASAFVLIGAELEHTDPTWLAGLNLIHLGNSLTSTEKFFSPLHRAHVEFLERHRPPDHEEIVGIRSIFFVGDSTFRNQFQAFCLGMSVDWTRSKWDRAPAPLFKNISAVDYRRPCGHTPTLNSNEPYESRCVGRWGNHRVQALHISSISIGASISKAVSEAPAPWTNVPPDVVYFGAGLWYLWPVPFATPMGDWPTFFDWRCLEAKVLETTRAYLNIATAHVVLSSVHNICDDSEWSGDWEFVMKTARTNMTEAVAPCVDALQNYEITNGH